MREATCDESLFGCLLNVLVLSVLASVTFDILFDVLVFSLYDVLVELVSLRELDFEFGSNTEVECKFKLFVLCKVDGLCAFVWQRFAEDVKLFVFNVFAKSLTNELVEFVGQYSLSVHFSNQSHRGVTFSETFYFCLLAVSFQGLFYAFFNVFSAYADIQCKI